MPDTYVDTPSSPLDFVSNNEEFRTYDFNGKFSQRFLKTTLPNGANCIYDHHVIAITVIASSSVIISSSQVC
jgi:hypothetical protein